MFHKLAYYISSFPRVTLIYLVGHAFFNSFILKSITKRDLGLTWLWSFEPIHGFGLSLIPISCWEKSCGICYFQIRAQNVVKDHGSEVNEEDNYIFVQIEVEGQEFSFITAPLSDTRVLTGC